MALPDTCPPVRVDALADLPARPARLGWAKQSAALLAQANEIHNANAGETPPSGETAWFHHYVCPETAHPLRFNPRRPHRHLCAATGREYEGERYDACWRAQMHAAWLAALERGAILERAGLGSEANRERMRQVLRHWARTWKQHADKPRGGVGKLMPQGLTEAIFQAGVCQVLQWLPDLMRGEDWRLLRDGMLASAAALLKPQWTGEDPGTAWGGRIHNISCWLNAAKFALGWALQDEELKDLAVNGPAGFRQQVAQGIDADGWWYEKTLTYQSYALQALLTHALLARSDGLDLIEEPKLARMATVLLRVLRDDGTLPSWNDGWRGRGIGGLWDSLEVLTGAGNQELAAHYAWLLERFDRTARHLNWLALPGVNAWMEELDGDWPARHGVAAMVWGSDELPDPEAPDRTHVFFPHSGIAVIEHGAVALSMRSGPHGGGHDHLDRTDITVRLRGQPVAEDLGTPAYGNPLVGTWYRQPAGHRLLIVDRRCQQPADGSLTDCGPRHISGHTGDAWPHARVHRTVRIDDDGWGWRDESTVDLQAPAQIDWIFHLRGEPLGADVLAEDDVEFTGGGLEHLANLRMLPPTPADATSWEMRWRTDAGVLALVLQADGLCAPTARLATCPDNPADRELTAILLSATADQHGGVTAAWRLSE
jgi:hypothetical protein